MIDVCWYTQVIPVFSSSCSVEFWGDGGINGWTLTFPGNLQSPFVIVGMLAPYNQNSLWIVQILGSIWYILEHILWELIDPGSLPTPDRMQSFQHRDFIQSQNLVWQTCLITKHFSTAESYKSLILIEELGCYGERVGVLPVLPFLFCPVTFSLQNCWWHLYIGGWRL